MFPARAGRARRHSGTGWEPERPGASIPSASAAPSPGRLRRRRWWPPALPPRRRSGVGSRLGPDPRGRSVRARTPPARALSPTGAGDLLRPDFLRRVDPPVQTGEPRAPQNEEAHDPDDVQDVRCRIGRCALDEGDHQREQSSHGADDEPIEAHASSVSGLHQEEEEQADHEAGHKERRRGQELLGGPRGFGQGNPETTQHPQDQVEPEEDEPIRYDPTEPLEDGERNCRKAGSSTKDKQSDEGCG